MTAFNRESKRDGNYPTRELILSYLAIYENELIQKCITFPTGFLFTIARFDVRANIEIRILQRMTLYCATFVRVRDASTIIIRKCLLN